MCVFFPEDQSFSKDIIFSDVVDYEKIGTPMVGQRLQIRWIDGKNYDADYIGKVDSWNYTVSFFYVISHKYFLHTKECNKFII